MKKFLILLLASVMVFSLAACGSSNEAKEDSGETSEAMTPATQCIAEFQKILNADASAGVEDIADKIVTAEFIPFGGATMPVEPGYLNGFTEEITGFKSGCFFGPMIGAIPFAGYVFELEDGADTEAFIALLHEKADLRWNICTSADQAVAGSNGNKVCFVMAPNAFEEE